MLCCVVLYCAALQCAALYCTVLCCIVLSFAELCYAVLQCTLLYCTEVYCTVQFCTVLYYALLCSDVLGLAVCSVLWFAVLLLYFSVQCSATCHKRSNFISMTSYIPISLHKVMNTHVNFVPGLSPEVT